MNTLRLHGLGQVDLATGADIDGLIKTVRTDTGRVIVALQEFVPVRDILFLQAEHDALDKRHRLARIIQQARLTVARLTGVRIGFAVEVGITLHHHLPVRVVDRQHIGAGTDREPVQRDIALLHAGL